VSTFFLILGRIFVRLVRRPSVHIKSPYETHKKSYLCPAVGRFCCSASGASSVEIATRFSTAFPLPLAFSPSGGDKKLEAFFRNSFAPAGEVEKFRSIATIKSGTRVIQTIAHCCFRGRSPGGRLGHLIYATNYFKSFVAAAILQIALPCIRFSKPLCTPKGQSHLAK